MWITRAAFDTLNAERIKATEEARVLAHQNAALHITLDWFRLNAEKWERERAYLLKTYMGIAVTVPHYVPTEPDKEDVLGGANIFQDIGDKAAKELGIDWDSAGQVKQ